MADVDWREAERAWQQAPDDQDLLVRALVTRSRAGLPPTLDLLEHRIHPARTFTARFPCTVSVRRPNKLTWDEVGKYRGRKGRTMAVPEHRRWSVRPRELTEGVVDELLREQVPEITVKTPLPPAARAALLRLAPTLRRLVLAGKVSDEDLEAAATLERLELLELDPHVNDRELGYTDRGLEALARLPRLEQLGLPGNPNVTPGGYSLLTRMPMLVRLRLNPTFRRDPNPILASLAGCANLAELDFPAIGEPLTAEGWAGLAGLPGLRTLDLRANLDRAGMESLVRSTPRLESLELDGQSFEDFDGSCLDTSCVEPLSALPLRRLRWFNVNELGDEAVELLGRITTLECLALTRSTLTDSGLEHLHGLERLSELDLYFCEWITGHGIAALPQASCLRSLEVRMVKMNDAGVLALNPDRLEYFDASFCRGIGDPSVDHLVRCSGLRFCDLQKTGVSTGAEARLRRALPECEVVASAYYRDWEKDEHIDAGRLRAEVLHLEGDPAWVVLNSLAGLGPPFDQPEQPPEWTFRLEVRRELDWRGKVGLLDQSGPGWEARLRKGLLRVTPNGGSPPAWEPGTVLVPLTTAPA